jgi:ribulose-phosphate 3-epimerase
MRKMKINDNNPFKKVEISASIMCIDWLHAGEQLKILEEQEIDYLHWDVIDGRFAPDFTMGSSIINKFRENTNRPSDYHLMVEEPSKLFDFFKITPGDIFTIHQECCRNLHRDLVNLRRKGARVGVALNPGTSLEVLDYIIEDIDVILVMSVNPGFMGQELVPQTIGKIEKIRERIDDMKLDIKISVDGNVSYENIPNMVAAGADILVGGSSGLFRNDIDLENSIKRLHECIQEGLENR